MAATAPQSQWKLPLQAEFLALRVTPVVAWRREHPLETLWLCERPVGSTTVRKYHLSNLPADASLKEVVQLAHTRWAIERQYQDFKTELGLDDFEGRSYPGWHHHMVISAVAYAFRRLPRVPARASPSGPHPSVRGREKGSKNKANAEVRELARTYTPVAIKTPAALSCRR